MKHLSKFFSFITNFFRAMWVYSTSSKIDEYLSIIHVAKEDLKLNWSGPVLDLKLHKSQVSFSVRLNIKFAKKNFNF